MSPRPRKSGRKGWPANLYTDRKAGKNYYRYRHPKTGKKHGLGTDLKKAIDATRILNARLVEDTESAQSLASAILTQGETAAKFLQRYAEEVLPQRTDKKGRPYSIRTLGEYQRMLKDAADALGGKLVSDVSRRDIVTHLAAYPHVSSNRRRSVLSKAFAKAVAEGLRETNPVKGTEAHVEVVKRKRLSLDQFLAIRIEAPAWFRNAMDLAIYTLQRREDIASMRFDQVEGDRLLVRQRKVETYGTGNIRIQINNELRSVIERCRDDIVSPYMVHRRPYKMRREYIEQKDHWSQVSPEVLTRTFRDLRDRHGVCEDLAPEQRPTFHEIRALGADLCREAGWSEESIKRLLGHTSTKMTRAYLDRHDGVAWVDADAVSGLLEDR